MAAAVKVHAGVRLGVLLTIGVVAGLIAAWLWDPIDAPLVGWAAASFAYIAWTWARIWRMDAEHTREHATAEDPARAVFELVVLLTSVASLAAVAVVLVQSRVIGGADLVGYAAVALGSVALSWLLIHTLYTVRYARLYYADPVGGIDFNQDSPPRYSDFAYVAFGLGMTFQVADTSLRSSAFRRVVLVHMLLSYVFGTVILATTINLVVGLTA